ncbi:MAG: hypothetical protein HW391_115 [Chloroflexi bacterium]|nr:hypothetical protein [Chloroflexota bacterium]
MLEGWGAGERPVALTLYTDAYVVRGTLVTRQRRLSDIMNEAEEDMLVLADVTFDRFGHGVGTHQAPFAQVNLKAVLFAVADTTIDPQPEFRTPKVAETALIIIPPFEITGRIHLLPARELRDALQDLHGPFVPVTDATYWSESAGEAARTAPMVAVNHARAQILSPYSSADGPAEGESPSG